MDMREVKRSIIQEAMRWNSVVVYFYVSVCARGRIRRVCPWLDVPSLT
jgi:hypothetical protein